MTDMPRWASDKPDLNDPLVWQPENALFAVLETNAEVVVNDEDRGPQRIRAMMRVVEVLEFIRVETGHGYALVRLVSGELGAWPMSRLVVGRA